MQWSIIALNFLYAALGVAMMFVAYRVIDLLTPKVDVEEELSRLVTHVAEFRRVLAAGGSAGKRLDFLAQELHRDENTLGSKSVDAEGSRAALELKVLIEQMREQVQNLE